jgi:preprotein translocase subunit SecF
VEFFSHTTSFPFMATRRVWYALSLLLVIGSIVLLFTRGLNLGIDFTGGVSVQATFSQPPSVEAVRARLTAVGFRDPVVQVSGSTRELTIRLPPERQATGSTDAADKLAAAIRARVTDALKVIDPQVQVASPDVYGPQVGSELQSSALWALGFTLILIGIYIAIRFHTWRLSLGAILAVLHDPILVLGIFAAAQTSFDLPVVAAVLAVIGYSLNDTVVVFDRIRERFEGNRRLPPKEILDQSINQTLSRTIMTKLVTSIVVVALLLLGGPVLYGFSLALLIGVIAGTYSSIYISSAIALDCGLTAEHIFPSVKTSSLDNMP